MKLFDAMEEQDTKAQGLGFFSIESDKQLTMFPLLRGDECEGSQVHHIGHGKHYKGDWPCAGLAPVANCPICASADWNKKSFRGWVPVWNPVGGKNEDGAVELLAGGITMFNALKGFYDAYGDLRHCAGNLVRKGKGYQTTFTYYPRLDKATKMAIMGDLPEEAGDKELFLSGDERVEAQLLPASVVAKIGQQLNIEGLTPENVMQMVSAPLVEIVNAKAQRRPDADAIKALGEMGTVVTEEDDFSL